MSYRLVIGSKSSVPLKNESWYITSFSLMCLAGTVMIKAKIIFIFTVIKVTTVLLD